MLNWILQLVFDESNAVFIDNGQDLQVQETKLVSGVSKVSHILGYNHKNLRLKVSHKWFLKRGDLLYPIITIVKIWRKHPFWVAKLGFDLEYQVWISCKFCRDLCVAEIYNHRAFLKVVSLAFQLIS